MHTELLDTVLVSRKEGTTQGESAAGTKAAGAANMKGLGSDTAKAGEEEKCPVDHKTREVWMQQARAASSAAAPPQSSQATTTTIPEQQAQQPSTSWSSWLRLPSFSQQSQEPTTANAAGTARTASQLDEARVISSIPRSSDPGPSACPVDHEQPPVKETPKPVNHEQETGASASGHWVYPSEKQFFDAMKRKGFDAAATDMKTVVPIHNAVNERAWGEILKWEAPYVAPVNQGCGGPRLHSFAGLGSATMSPKARINTLLGYTAPFDRHDWVVDRCGTKVEYVIDFYAGRNDGTGANKLNFYLDVRPKLNTWEGVKMRAMRATGMA